MRWIIKHGDILDEPADVLICSANVQLNLSGGVGGALLLRYGHEMQEYLHRWLAEHDRRFVARGDVIETPPCGTPYSAVLHAVAVDGFYDTSAQCVEDVLLKALSRAAELGAKTVALTALATGYGKLSINGLAKAIKPLLGREFPPISELMLCLRNQDAASELADALPGSIRHSS